MTTMLQIRDVPEAVHRKLKARAAVSGMSLSAYAREVLTRAVDRPTADELTSRIRARGAVSPSEPTEAAVRSLRDNGE